MSNQKFKYLVADTSAFIKNKALQEIADQVLTVSDVMREIKNRRQIRRLCTLPYELEVRDPHPENIRYVTEYSKKTGDYMSLSAVDLKVIALTYQLEKEHVGSDHLNPEPIKATTIISKDRPAEFEHTNHLAGFFVPKDNGDEEEEENNDSDDEIEKKILSDKAELSLTGDLNQLNVRDDENLDKILVSVIDRNGEEENDDEEFEEKYDYSDEENDAAADSDEDDDDDGWITPGNIKVVKKKFGLDVTDGDIDESIPKTPVACMSTDYSIQNVLKQIGLNVASFDGKVIKDMRTYILRCYACFKTTSIVTKIFCPNCGNKTLKRVAVSLDDNGKQVIHVNTRRSLTAFKKNQSLPRPRGGKHSCNPILFEDQPIPKQMPSRVARTKTNALDEDYIAGYSPFVVRDVDSKSAILRGNSNLKQLMKNNAFDNNRRYMKKKF